MTAKTIKQALKAQGINTKGVSVKIDGYSDTFIIVSFKDTAENADQVKEFLSQHYENVIYY